jgi:hypothetical protein
MQMADRDGQRISGVVRLRRLIETEQELDHLLDLVLFSTAIADDGALDLRWRVFHDWTPCFDRRKHGHATRVPELERAADVDCVKQAFNGNTIWGATDQ